MARRSGPACAPAPTGRGPARGASVLKAAWALAWVSFCAFSWAQAAPAAPVPEATSEEREWRYRIAPGDTLISLATTYMARPEDWQRLQRLNGVSDPRRLVPGSRLRMPYAWLKREAAVAEVVFVRGRVTLQRPGAAADVPVALGTRVQVADALSTGAQSSLSLRFVDGSRLLVSPDSRVSIEQLLVYGRSGITESRLRVDAGGVNTEVRPDAERAPVFEMRTPAINLGVRGTEFRLRVDAQDGASRVEVTEGRVGTAASRDTPGTGSAVEVAAGFGVLARPDEPMLPPRALLPPPRLDFLPGPIEQLPLTLGWSLVEGASGYRAQLFAAERSDALLREALFAGSPARWPDSSDLPDGDYRLRLGALDEFGIEGRQTEMRFELRARPLAPVLRQPAPGARLAAEVVQLSWNPSAEMKRYRLQVAGANGFGSPLLDRGVDGTQVRIALPPGSFQWRVATWTRSDPIGNLRQGPFGLPQAFELRAVPPLPVLEPPQFSPSRLLLRWKALAAGQGLQLQLADNPAFSPVLLEHSTWGSEWSLPRPAAGRYHLRIRSLVGDGPVGAYAAPTTLDVPVLPWWEQIWLPAAGARP
jgi:hypothetical protein